jgi:glycosyltransferase involved in cell wall biosynthesis
MRILFCQSVPYIPQDQGGALSNTHALCRRLRSLGCEAEVLAKDSGGIPSLIGRLGRNVGTSYGFDYRVRRERDPLAAARKICRAEPPDLAVVQLGRVSELCEIFLQASVPTICFIHDVFSLPVREIGGGSRQLQYAACSQFVAGRIRERLACEAIVIPVLIEPEFYQTSTERRVVTFVNPIPRKGLEVVFSLAAYRPDIPFEFVESWRLRGRVATYLGQRVAHHGNIRFTTRTSDMRPIYARSRIVISPSLGDEAWGRVVSEAQINAIPALASNSGGLPEAVGPGGIIVDRYAPMPQWLSALGTLWDNHAEYDRLCDSAARHAARPEFQPDMIAERALQVFQEHARTGS